MERKSLADIDFNSYSKDEKRFMFITMDAVLKNVHEHNRMVTSFKPKDIYYNPNTSLIEFDQTYGIKPEKVNSKDEAILQNITDLSILAFCSYLDEYDPSKDGLLNPNTISEQFNNFTNIFDKDDVDYYRSVLVYSHNTHELPKDIYYTDYLKNREMEKTTKGQKPSNVYVKATQVGKLLSDKENEQAAFGSQFFMVSSIASILLLIVGFILYLINM